MPKNPTKFKCDLLCKTANSAKVPAEGLFNVPEALRSVEYTCEVCQIVLPSVVAYMFHKDHHPLPMMPTGQPVIHCVGCVSY